MSNDDESRQAREDAQRLLDADPELRRLVGIHQDLQGLAATIAEVLPHIKDLSLYGTDELPAALGLIVDHHLQGGPIDTFLDACEWATRSYTRSPINIRDLPDGEHTLALSGAIMMLRISLNALAEGSDDDEEPAD